MNLKGGYKLIDLSLIALVLGTPSGDKTAITEPKILDQLLTLREYIEGDKELKPVYIRAKSTNGKDVVMASLARSASGLNYYIDAKFTDTLLKLIVVFELNEETLEYEIKSAEYLYTADVDNVQNEVTKAEAGTIIDVLGLDEDDGLVKGAVPFENIKDKDGHNRFIEGELNTEDITGLTFNYKKWSLSGTHLMLVLAGSVEVGIALTSGTKLASVQLPKWIMDKIYPVWEQQIEAKTVVMRDSTWVSQNTTMTLAKSTLPLGLSIFNQANVTISTSIKNFRIQFDLLIDNE